MASSSSSSSTSSEESDKASPEPFGQASSGPKKSRLFITDAQRKDLRIRGQALIRENGKWTTPQMVEFFNDKYGRVLTQSTISVSLSDKFKHLDNQVHPLRPDSKKRRESKWPDLDAALFEWQHRMLANKIAITNEHLKITAKDLFDRLPQCHDLKPPKFSSHWLKGFKARYEVKKYNRDGNLDGGKELETLREKLKLYDCEDIYTVDETTLFWKMSPESSLRKEIKAGGTLEKARITVALACNVTGTRKLPPWIIGKARSPRCFSQANVHVDNFPMVWRYNRKAWMTGAIFEQYLQWFDRQMDGRKVCLIVDEFSAHKAGVGFLYLGSPEALRNTRLLFLPAITKSEGSFRRPLDQGIFFSWKAQYRRRWLAFMCYEYEVGDNPMGLMNVLHAIRWAVAAWEADVTPTTIRSGWINSHVLGDKYIPEPQGVQIDVHTNDEIFNHTMTQLEQQIGSLVQQKHIQSAMNIDTFVNPDDEIVDDNDENVFEAIVETYGTGGDEREYETDEYEVHESVLDDDDALDMVSQLRKYEEQQEGGNDVIISQLNKYESDIRARESLCM